MKKDTGNKPIPVSFFNIHFQKLIIVDQKMTVTCLENKGFLQNETAAPTIVKPCEMGLRWGRRSHAVQMKKRQPQKRMPFLRRTEYTPTIVREGGLVIAQTSAEVWFPAVAGAIFGREPCSPRKPPSSWRRNMWVQVPNFKKNQPPFRMTDSFWCARGDLNPHARNEH